MRRGAKHGEPPGRRTQETAVRVEKLETSRPSPYDEVKKLKERVQDAEIALATWDNGRNSEYWLRHPTPIPNGEL